MEKGKLHKSEGYLKRAKLSLEVALRMVNLQDRLIEIEKVRKDIDEAYRLILEWRRGE